MEEKWESFRCGCLGRGWRGAQFSKSQLWVSGVLDKEVEVGVRRPVFPTSPTGELKRAVKSRESV